jgi:hypothetical protein
MSDPGVGGRGKKAPYETTHYRIPEPTKPVVEILVNKYRQTLGSQSDPTGQALLTKVEEAILDTQSQQEDTSTALQLSLLRDECRKLKANQQRVKLLLQEALTLRSNAGGAIKVKIREVINLLD